MGETKNKTIQSTAYFKGTKEGGKYKVKTSGKNYKKIWETNTN